MKFYTIVVRRVDQKFIAIVRCVSNEITSANLEKYSTLITDEATARVNFTLTGHLPSEEFEEMLALAKE
jgi:hypothetical protein